MLFASDARELTLNAIETMLESHVINACDAMESTVTVDLSKTIDDAIVPLVVERMDRRGYYVSTWVIGVDSINRLRLTWNKPKPKTRKSTTEE